MKIVYFYQYFSTPKGSWGTRVYEFTREWVKAGHDVTVVSSVYSKSDLKAVKFIEDQVFEGVKVKVINVEINNKHSFYKRISAFLLYSFFSSYYALTLKADLVIASSGPITIGIPALLARYVRGRKMVFETRDLWPEGAIELGYIKNPLMKKFSYWFEKQCYKASSYIVTLSPGMKENIEARFGLTNVGSVTNAANIELFSDKRELPSGELKPKTYAIYTGNIGDVNNSFWLLDAAKYLKEKGRGDITILLIGDGPQRKDLERLSEEDSITNLMIKGLMPKEDLISYVQNSFVSLVPLKDTPMLGTSSPNKFFESLAAGVPVIQTTQGWMKEFLEKHEIGFTENPNSAKDLAERLIWMKDHPEELVEMGNRASVVAKENFDKDYLANKMLTMIEKAYNG